MVTGIRATALWIALALAGPALPAMADARTARPAPAAELETQEKADAAQPAADAKADPAEAPSDDVAQLTRWVIASGDNHGQPFIVVDKVAARVFVHDGEGKLVGSTPALLGVTPGDDSVPGVGDRELSEIKPEDRTTPAGRFVAKFGKARYGSKVLWVDYATSISLHPVITTRKKERRLQRLRSATPEDNRITYGCINVPTAFYAKVVRPAFTGTAGIVYILPETRPLKAVFLAFRPMAEPSLTAEASPVPAPPIAAAK
ncbi:MAG TPA: hypothetical protein VJ859_13175 [Allosphingosinicella sp.]|nr:hypothetical protein [Allosphingosinicella sp.]